MSWDCPHQKKDECVRLKKLCLPLQKGCVLEGRVQYIDYQPDKREEVSNIKYFKKLIPKKED
ncbi:hypothetical protein KsCSTR_04780 [Candidatus Kuenenia stuttgartiensis]|jgi:hypothetical protein|uniref:Uncharacterized protein n=1 Tax=Kuenenia stuttgartiensis TaxID=174633 RepID=Q1Q0B5_KUEST|nr:MULTISPECIES: hypothetical protein [Kuenenia]MBE7546491.1 hypothetical protein [Planctomycetia bacterium]MBZ0193225.1 hypothetical protein [Candidatus Kuenenia stuttgartiensis]MCL4728608.1 hypothetical protein [Candidatus Kuenenia stuttgartiensis]MCZ7621879.1 hypothetical protein [Candidatus Kuenenia sp.]QII09857.1 hypothetical protein KsCSTR_04780 [Candidatus Kuenenia stuttgartiensis]